MIFKKQLVLILSLIFIILVFLPASTVFAFEITSDPQFVVINFADFYFSNWQAPEKEWQKDVKPKIREKLQLFKTLLTTGTPNRRLAWSTLLEYTNFPLDKISEKSAYVIQAKRIMEVAEEENFPVFMPLNGVQWWDNVPELWNYWDPDGNHTPGCENKDYSRCKFEKLKDPIFRARFIKGYNANNKWNVEWADWHTPMGFNVRNWGGGDVYVAPPANIVDHKLALLSFKKFQTDRYEAILNVIAAKITNWEKSGKQDLFAGLTIGTEVSLNGSVQPGDENFRPYGYRALQDTFCVSTKPTCGAVANWSADRLEIMRETVINNYFNDMAQRAAIKGIPKQRIYTHVWSEADRTEKKYTDAIGASVTLYSRAGLSIYGRALNPMGFSLLKTTLQINGYPAWAAPEFSPLTHDGLNWDTALGATLDNTLDPPRVIDVYNERDIVSTSAMEQLRKYISEKNIPHVCHVPEILSLTADNTLNPKTLRWKNIPTEDAPRTEVVIFRSKKPTRLKQAYKIIQIQDPWRKTDRVHNWTIPKDITDGRYYWVMKNTGCDGTKWTTSEPHFFEKSFIAPPTLWEKIIKVFNKIL